MKLRDLSLSREGAYVAYATEPLIPEPKYWGTVEVCSVKTGELITAFYCKCVQMCTLASVQCPSVQLGGQLNKHTLPARDLS
jgi:hypothetical protein